MSQETCRLFERVWSMEYGVRSMEYGVRSKEYGVRNMEYGILSGIKFTKFKVGG